MKVKTFLYGTPFKRVLMRFIEIFVLGGLSAVLLAPEAEQLIVPMFGTSIAATLFKLFRELRN